VKAELCGVSPLIWLHHKKINDIAFTDMICLVNNGKIRQDATKKGVADRKKKKRTDW